MRDAHEREAISGPVTSKILAELERVIGVDASDPPAGAPGAASADDDGDVEAYRALAEEAAGRGADGPSTNGHDDADLPVQIDADTAERYRDLVEEAEGLKADRQVSFEDMVTETNPERFGDGKTVEELAEEANEAGSAEGKDYEKIVEEANSPDVDTDDDEPPA